MYNGNDEEDDAAALIDSYFLPGGILDPEDINGNGSGNGNGNGNGNGDQGGQSNRSTSTRGQQQSAPEEILMSRLERLAMAGSALDPTADDVIGGSFLMGSPVRPLAGDRLQHQHTLGNTHGHGHVHQTNMNPHFNVAAQHVPVPVEPIREFNDSDWFSGNTTSATNNAHEDELSNFLRGALQSHDTTTMMPPASSPVNSTQLRHYPASKPQAQVQVQAHASYSSASIESRTTNATSHIQRNPWSTDDLTKKQQSSAAQLMYASNYTSRPAPIAPAVATSVNASLTNPSLGNYQQINPLAMASIRSVPTPVNDTAVPVSQQAVRPRPPPGFLSSPPQTTASEIVQRAAPQASAHDPPTSPYQEHDHELQAHRKKIAYQHHDGDNDLSSLNTKSSRDVPSTIYVQSIDEDAISNSEDTLTVCADSVTEASLLCISKVESERTFMDVLEEASANEVSKLNDMSD